MNRSLSLLFSQEPSSQQGFRQSSHQTVRRTWSTTWLVLSEGMSKSDFTPRKNKKNILLAVLTHHALFLDPHSTAPPSTQSSWKQLRHQSEQIWNFSLNLGFLGFINGYKGLNSSMSERVCYPQEEAWWERWGGGDDWGCDRTQTDGWEDRRAKEVYQRNTGKAQASSERRKTCYQIQKMAFTAGNVVFPGS